MLPGDSNGQPSLRTTLIRSLVQPNISSTLFPHICFVTVLKVVKIMYYIFLWNGFIGWKTWVSKQQPSDSFSR